MPRSTFLGGGVCWVTWQFLQEETRLLWKMSPASHFFFFEKVEKNNDNKSVHSCRRKLRANFQSRFLFPMYFQEIGQSSTRSHAIACYHCKILERHFTWTKTAILVCINKTTISCLRHWSKCLNTHSNPWRWSMEHLRSVSDRQFTCWRDPPSTFYGWSVAR
jgi:hypothetical protein